MKVLLLGIITVFIYNAFAQNANVDLTMRVTRTAHSEYGSTGGDCWETGTEEYTGLIWFWTDADATQRGGTCRQCDNNGNCTNNNITDTYTYTNTSSYVIDGRIDAWEDDGGSRCAFDGGDDCRTQKNLSTWTAARNFREIAYPSNGTYQTYAGNANELGNDDNWGQIAATWRYSGTASLITPSCVVQTTAYTAGGIRSWSANLTAGVIYNFNTCSSASNDTYLRIYGPDGYTIVGAADDNCGVLSSINYTAASTGTYYIEVSQYSRGVLALGGTLSYSIVTPTLGTVSNAGPINFCDAGGNFTTAVSVSGQTGTIMWDWGSNNGVWNNNWVAGSSSGVCCFPKKISNSDGNADRIRYRVVNGACSVTSSTILIVNKYNEAPTTLTSSTTNYCATAAPATITLTATFPTNINMNGTIAFYSGSCGGTLVGTVSPAATSSTGAITIAAPATTTTYYARYEPGVGSGCANSACAQITVTVDATPTLGTPSNAGPIEFCDVSGNFTTAVTVSGQTGTVNWNWGSNNGAWNAWVAGNTSGVCCFPIKTSNSDGNADRMRYQVTNGSCPAVISVPILIVNKFNENPSSLTSTTNSYCTASAPATITLTANFPFNINMNGTIRFYSGSCGGTLVGTVNPAATSTTGAITIAAPATTTTYYARYEPGAGTGCANTVCVQTTVTVNVTSVAPTSISGLTNICTGGSTTLTATGGTIGTGAVVQWYTGSCGGTLIGTGTSISVSPGAATTYFVRYSGTCNTTACASVTVTPSTMPAVPTVSATTTQICSSGTTVFNANEMAPGGRVINFANPAMPQSGTTAYTSAPNTFTMELWVNPTTTRTTTAELNGVNDINGTAGWGQHYAITPSHQNTNGGAGISVGTNGVSVYEHGAGYMPSLLVWDGAVTGWTHVAVVYNAKTPSLYINGSLVKTGLTSQKANVYPSAGTGGFYGEYLGGIDNVRIWNYARSQAEIQTNMYWENPSNATGLIGHYTFDADNYNASVGTSVGNNNGTFSNANYYTYTWSSGPALPIASTNEAQTSGTISTIGTHNYVVTASANGCTSANSVPVAVTVDSPSTAPTGVTGGGTFCQGNNVILTPTGGTLGSSASYQWYSGSCSGGFVGTGNTATVSPSTSTNYFVYAGPSGACPATACVDTWVNMPSMGSNLSQNGEAATCVVNDNNYVHFFHSSGRLLASINSNGQNLGNVQVTSYVVGAPIDVPACNTNSLEWTTTVMGRNWVITPQFQPTTPVTVILPFETSVGGEFDQLAIQANANLNVNDDVAGIGSLKLSKYSGPLNVDNNPINNCLNQGGSANTTIHNQVLNGAVNGIWGGFNPNAHYVGFSVNSFSEFWIHGSNTSSPLPIEMGAFSLECNDQTNTVIIKWQTLSETNTMKFELEKSSDYLNWVLVGERTAAGNSSSTINYQIIDEQQREFVYYRLKQIDNNGDFKYYNIGISDCYGSINSKLYPNPSSGIVTFSFNNNSNAHESWIEISDIYGKTVERLKIYMVEGKNTAVFDVSSYSNGTYFVSISSLNGSNKPIKLVKID